MIKMMNFSDELVEHHVSGQLKVAPEHVSDTVLHYMGKPTRSLYDRFVRNIMQLIKSLNKDQYLVPYLMSSHPGCDLHGAIELAEYLRDINHQPEQVQDFYPTPGTLSTTMFYTGVDPRTMTPVYVPKNPHEKAMQRALIQYKNPKNYDLVYEALQTAGRLDLIGYGSECLIKPVRPRLDVKGGKPAGKSNQNNKQKQQSKNHQKSGNKKTYGNGKKKRYQAK